MKRRKLFHRLQQKRYSSGSYKNPYFRTEKKKSYQKPLFIIGGVAASLLIFLLTYFFSYPSFKLTSVEILGISSDQNTAMEEMVQTYLSQRKFFFFRNSNRFLFSHTNFQEYVQSSFVFEKIETSIQKQKLSVTIQEKTAYFIWKSNSKKYIVDKNGLIIQEVGDDAQDHLPLFVDRANGKVEVGDSVLTKEVLESIFLFQERLEKIPLAFTETAVDIKEGKWIGIKTQKGYLVLFDPAMDIDKQVIKLKSVLAETIQDEDKLDYIDLRFGDHVYFK